MTLKKKFIFPVFGSVILIALLSNIIARTVLDRQNRQASHEIIERAFQITEDALVLKEISLLEYSQQFESRPVHYTLNKLMKLGDKPHRISAITYKNTVEIIHSLGVSGKTIEVFNGKGRLILFSVSEPGKKDEILSGYIHHKEKIVVTARTKAGARISFNDWQINTLAVPGGSSADLPDEKRLDWELKHNESQVFVCLPILKKIYENKEYRQAIIGWIKVSEPLDDQFFRRLKGLTGTQINLFTRGGKFSMGTLHKQAGSIQEKVRQMMAAVPGTAGGQHRTTGRQGMDIHAGPASFDQIRVADTGYAVGVRPVQSGPEPVGAACILYSTESLDGNARQMMMVLNLVLLLFFLMTFFLMMTVSKQVTAQKKADRLKRYLDNVINSMPSILIGVDSEGKITQWNHTAEQKTGIFAREAKNKPLAQVMPRMAREMEIIKKSIQEQISSTDKKKAYAADEGICYEDITIYPLATNGIEGAVIRIDDVTEAVRMEEMMIQSEKMLSIGGLAAGMAHEINNPLAGMIQTASVLSSRLASTDMKVNLDEARQAGTSMEAIQKFMRARKVPEMLSTIRDSGNRVAQIVNNMLSFARKADAQVSSCSLADLLDNTLSLAKTDFDLKKSWDFKLIKIQKNYDPNLPPVPCESGKIQQVVLNLLKNGAQAMQEAGTVEPEFKISTRFDEEKEMACLEIADNGPGMEKELCKRIFEPFFTTKPAGIGTGLGLSVSYFIVTENHGGTMTVDSTPGKGTLFTVCLPLEKKGQQEEDSHS
ncbi:MAG: PAS domain S-box protein [Desulfobacter sp.]|nr:MAG: PAS domain S-box protein [Desulfobacter sp.]